MKHNTALLLLLLALSVACSDARRGGSSSTDDDNATDNNANTNGSCGAVDQTRCDGKALQRCDGTQWRTQVLCGAGCDDGACIECTPACDDGAALCGDDGCGGSCGDCGQGERCDEGACVEAMDGPGCGDGACDDDEDCSTCEEDCGACCGDGACGGDETCASCVEDCGCADAERCDAAGECVEPPEGCGDNTCDDDEDCATCAEDCGECCGNDACDAGETCSSCVEDCACDGGEICNDDAVCEAPVEPCGDGTCDDDEDCTSCEADCGACPGDCPCDAGPGCTASCACDAACGPLTCAPFVPELDVALPLTTLRDVALSAPDRGWAVGSHGIVLRLDDDAWSVTPSPARKLLFAVDLVDDQNGWAVGHEGEMLRMDDGVWTSVDSGDPFESSLHDVDVIDMDNGWAVGSGGTLLRLAGGAWERVDGDIGGSTLRDIQLFDADNGLAVSISGSAVALEDGVWRENDDSILGYGSNMSGIYAIDAQTAWGVGRRINALTDGSWDNVVYSLRDSGELYAIDLDGDVGWAVGFRAGYTLRDGEWESGDCSLCRTRRMYGVDLEGGGGWTVGGPSGPAPEATGSVMASLRTDADGQQRWVERSYQRLTSRRLTTVDLWDRDNGWAGGEEGAVFLLQDGVWSAGQIQLSSNTITDIALGNPGEGWAVGESGRVFRLQNGFWALDIDLDEFDGTHDVLGLDVLPGGGGWAVGNGPHGELFVRHSGGAWTEMPGDGEPEPFDVDALFDVALIDANNGWAVGGNALSQQTIVWRLRDGVWSKVDVDFTGLLLSVALEDDTNGWAVGGIVNLEDSEDTSGTPLLLRLEDGIWTEVDTQHPRTVLVDVDLGAGGLGWAVGTQGVVMALRPDGVTTCEDGGLDVGTLGARPFYNAGNDLNGVAIAPDGSAVLVGERGIRARTR